MELKVPCSRQGQRRKVAAKTFWRAKNF